ncbi:MAG: hypothetical protein IPP93_05680 [Chitinophagaceae bacterium]|nr:hypothetical protein [Chitinophagaceae bacterium]
MKRIPILIFPLFLLFVSCQQKKNTASSDKNNSATDTTVALKPDQYYSRFDSNKTEIENYEAGYMDTFSVNGNRFRLYSKKGPGGDLSLDVFRNDAWLEDLQLPYGSNGFSHDTDMNNDGYMDFRNSRLRGSEVHFYDPSRHQFTTVPVYLAFDWGKIDKARNIYYNNYKSGNLEVSNVFLLAGFKQNFLYTALLNYPTDLSVSKATIRLYKLFNHNLNDTQFVNEKQVAIPGNGFDYKKYWQEALSNTEYK